MSAVIENPIATGATESDQAPIVIVGTGPVGIRCAQSLLSRNPAAPIVIYGDEPWEPYDRVRLSALLSGDESWQSLQNPLVISSEGRVLQHHNCAVVEIDRDKRCVLDETGRRQPYDKLILAVGSRPHIPSIPNIDLPGIYSFRDMSDAERLIARTTRSRQTIVVGGGLLGLEAARGLQRAGTDVTVVEHANRLMASQLDEAGSAILERSVRELGVRVITDNSVKTILGKERIKGVLLRDGRAVLCDTMVLATGIRPYIDLARDCGLAIGRGIKVDDRLQTSDAHIFAAGECVEHNGKVYGMVAPGFEQADVLASCLSGEMAVYRGSVAAARLKVVGESVFSVGESDEGQSTANINTAAWRDETSGQYRKLVYRFNRLVGAMGVGEWLESQRIQEAVESKRRIWPWQLWQFRKDGRLWSEDDAADVATWPAHARVCNCKSINRGTLTDAMARGCTTIESLAECTGASTVCGSCKPLLADLVGNNQLDPERGANTLSITAVISVLIALAFLLLPNIPYNSSVADSIQWDQLWRNGLLKQITGFSVLGLGVLISLISLRKRISKFTLGGFPVWRVIHVGVGLLTVVMLLAHTGLRVGDNLNQLLMLSFVSLILFGAVASWAIGRQHALPRVIGKRVLSLSIWGHILLLWPVPALVGFHVLKTYWY